ncbi:hypothetical protein VNO78_03682 [Psophocarpus tetragonolobus]|uniref:Uncharacterized protein n=1 Tax=Psophocarpus tetragonolobus TaxID=3891 RepID=A0AAN9XWX7_PSOTE
MIQLMRRTSDLGPLTDSEYLSFVDHQLITSNKNGPATVLLSTYSFSFCVAEAEAEAEAEAKEKGLTDLVLVFGSFAVLVMSCCDSLLIASLVRVGSGMLLRVFKVSRGKRGGKSWGGWGCNFDIDIS